MHLCSRSSSSVLFIAAAIMAAVVMVTYIVLFPSSFINQKSSNRPIYDPNVPLPSKEEVALERLTPPTPPKHAPLPIVPIPKTRADIPTILEKEGFTVGMEIGVQGGAFSRIILERWPSARQFFLVDPWEQQQNYEDHANIDQKAQDELFRKTLDTLSMFKDKIITVRGYSEQVAARFRDQSFDFIYVDARHDYKSVLRDLYLYWPKLKDGGIIAGHDYVNADEAQGQRWDVNYDGTIAPDKKAVRGAVEEFSAHVGRQIVVCYRDGNWASWMMRK